MRKDSAPRNSPITFPRIAVSVGFPMWHTQLFKIANSCSWSFPLFPNIHAYSEAQPAVPVVYSALSKKILSVLWLLLTSHSLLLLCRLSDIAYSPASVRPPRVRATTFTSYICCIYVPKLGQYRTSFCDANSSTLRRLICSFCSSDRGFAHSRTFKPLYPASFRFRLTTDTLAFG